MKVESCITLVLALLCTLVATAQTTPDNDFGVWTSVDVSKRLTDRWSVGMRGEYRTRDLSRTTNLWFVRPSVGYKPLPWLALALSYDYFWRPAVAQHRALFDISETYSTGGLTVSLRERFIAAYAPKGRQWSWLFRPRLTVKYRIGETRCSPYIAFELYANRHWTMMHNFAGLQVALGHGSSLDLFYLFGLNNRTARQDHIVGVGYGLKL